MSQYLAFDMIDQGKCPILFYLNDRLAALIASRPAQTVRSLLATFLLVAPKPKESSYLRACHESAKSVAAMGKAER